MPPRLPTLACVVLTLAGLPLTAQERKPGIPVSLAEPGGKDVAFNNARITRGTRLLSGTEPAGEFFEFREETSTLFASGILTLVPPAALQHIEYAPEPKTVTAQLLAADGKPVRLQGTTKYVGINRLQVQYERDLPGMGRALLRFDGGEPKSSGGIVRFSAASPVRALPAGPKASVVAQDKEKSRHEVVGLVPFYQVGKDQRPHPEIFFRIDLKLPWSKVRVLRALPLDKKQPGPGFELVQSDGTTNKLLLADSVTLGSPAGPAKLLGFLGRVPAGYKLFPPHTVAELTIGEADAPKNP